MGIDIGGTGVKAGLVDTVAGRLVGERLRVDTPPDSGPGPMTELVADLVARLSPDAPVGIGFPGPVVHGRVMAAPHLSATWVGRDAAEHFGRVLGRPCTVLNDADAAGLAEARLGAGEEETGVVLMITLGTGIGSALLVGGTLVPNLEFGHIEVGGVVAETRAAARVRVDEGLGWDEWADRLETYLRRIDALVWPDLIILGGEITVEARRFLPLVDVRPRLAVARLRNAAGTVGAALAAARQVSVSG